MLNPFLPYVYVLPTDPSINWESSLITKEQYIDSLETWNLRYFTGQSPNKFHIRRLSFNEIQTSKELTDSIESKLFILNLSLHKIETNTGEVIIQNDCIFENELRELIGIEDLHLLADQCWTSQRLTAEQFDWLKMSAWVNTEQLDKAMQVPCGCALFQKAEEEIDKSAREVLKEEAPEFQKEWNCPSRCKDKNDIITSPSERAMESVIPLANLTKINQKVLEQKLYTCPKYILSSTWISEAINYYNWRDKSQLNILFSESKLFKNTIKEAIDAISAGINRYQQYQNEQFEKQRKAAANS